MSNTGLVWGEYVDAAGGDSETFAPHTPDLGPEADDVTHLRVVIRGVDELRAMTNKFFTERLKIATTAEEDDMKEQLKAMEEVGSDDEDDEYFGYVEKNDGTEPKRARQV